MKLSASALGYQHKTSGPATGVLVVDQKEWDRDRGVWVFPDSTDGGLIDPHVDANMMAPFCTTVHIVTTGDWTIKMTSGLDDGTSATLDDPANDAPIEEGTGNALVLINREFLRSQRLRITCSTPILFIASMIVTTTSGGRVIA